MAYYSRSITIDHTKCGSSNSTDFPVLVKLSHADLKTIANGGKVRDSSGYDICFSSDSAGASLYSWEMVKYDGTNGTVEAWVKIPTVSSSTDTAFYITYGKWASSYSFQGGSTGAAWNSAYKHVVHTGDGTTLDLNDKTSNGTNGTNSSGTATTGKVGGGIGVTAGSKYTTSGNLANIIGSSATHTIEMWVKFTTQGATNYIWDLDTGNGLGAFCNLTATTHEWGYGGSYRSYTSISTTTGTWYYCAWVKTASGDNGKFYINGVEQTSYSNSLGNPNASGSGGQFGAYHSSGVLCLDGVIDETRISNVARSADWILTSYNNQNDTGNIGSAGFYTVGSESVITETRYWVGGTATWNSTVGTKWATSSGGTGGAPVPTADDNARFDSSSGSGTVNIADDDVKFCKDLNFSGFTGTFQCNWASSGTGVTFGGDLTFGSGMTVSGNPWFVTSTNAVTHAITTNGLSIKGFFLLQGTGATYNFQDDFTNITNSDLFEGVQLDNGTLNSNNHNMTMVKFASSGSNTRVLNMGTGTWTITGTGTAWSMATVTNLTLNASTSTIKFTNTSGTAVTFAGGGKTFNNLWFSRGSSTAGITITGANTFNELKDDGSGAHTITFPNSTTTMTTWNINGTASNTITIQRTGGSGSFTVSQASGTVNAQYLSISNSTATGGATWNALYSTDGGGNSGWNFVTIIAANVQTATFSIPSYTVDTVRNVTISASVQSATFSIPSYIVSNDALYNATVQSATFSIPAYTVVTPDVIAAPSVQSATFTIPAYTVSAERYVTISASVVSATFSIPTYSAGTDITVSMSTPPSAVFSAQSSTVTGGATVAPSVQTATFSIPSYSVDAIQNVTLSPSAQTATFSVPSYTITTTQNPTITPTEQILTVSIPTYTVIAQRNVTVSASVAAATFSIPTYVASTSVSIAATVQVLTASIPTYTITAIRNVTISAEVLAFIVTIPSYRVRGDYWQNNILTRTKSWSDNIDPDPKTWVDQNFS